MISKTAPDRVVIEVGPQAGWVYDLVTAMENPGGEPIPRGVALEEAEEQDRPCGAAEPHQKESPLS